MVNKIIAKTNVNYKFFFEYDRTVKLGLKSVKRPMIQFRTEGVHRLIRSTPAAVYI
jgi:hypothetical protein